MTVPVRSKIASLVSKRDAKAKQIKEKSTAAIKRLDRKTYEQIGEALRGDEELTAYHELWLASQNRLASLEQEHEETPNQIVGRFLSFIPILLGTIAEGNHPQTRQMEQFSKF